MPSRTRHTGTTNAASSAASRSLLAKQVLERLARLVRPGEERYMRRAGLAITRFALASALTTGPAACYYDDATTVQIRNPSAVRLRRAWAGATTVALPEGRGPVTASVTAGTFPTGQATRARYQVDAVRAEDGATTLRVGTSVPLQNGDEHLIVPASGLFALEDPVPPALLQAPELRLLRCLSLQRVYAYEGGQTGYEIVFAPSCHGGPAIPLQIETPWSNVLTIQRVSTPRRVPAITGLVIGSFLATLGGVLLAVNKAAGIESSGLAAAGGLSLGGGGVLGFASLPGLVLSTKTTSLNAGPDVQR